MRITTLLYLYGFPLLQPIDTPVALNAEQTGKLLVCLAWLILPIILLSEWRRRRRARRRQVVF